MGNRLMTHRGQDQAAAPRLKCGNPSAAGVAPDCRTTTPYWGVGGAARQGMARKWGAATSSRNWAAP